MIQQFIVALLLDRFLDPVGGANAGNQFIEQHGIRLVSANIQRRQRLPWLGATFIQKALNLLTDKGLTDVANP